MALTAPAQSALPFAWDETIVPALRKRLENESRMLAKRMSNASIPSQDESYLYSSNPDGTPRERNASPSDYGRLIPRSSNAKSKQSINGNATLTHHRTDTTSSSDASRVPQQRQRTYSQPQTYDGPLPNGHSTGSNGVMNGLPTPDASRSTSPLSQQQALGRTSDVKPTRIPVVSRNRAPSDSSHGHSSQHGRSFDVSRSGPSSPPPVGPQPEPWAVEETGTSGRSRPTASSQRPGILKESVRSKSGSLKSSVSIRRERAATKEEETARRPSTDSEERPFEHWYRGDVHRNGGVGELRVGGKQEMLDIANYGHKYGGKNKTSMGPTTLRGLPSTDDFPTRRKRAGSFTEGSGRESFYMDEERAKALDNVLHEDPLTDLEGDGDHDMSNSYDDGVSPSTLPMPSPPPEEPRSITPTNNRSLERERNAPQTRIPGPAPRQSSEPAQTPQPTQGPHLGGSEPPTFSASTSSTSTATPGRTQSNRSQQSAPPSPMEPHKRRAKSPAAPSASKKAKKAAKSPARSKAEDEKNRRSVAVYPQPAGDNVMDAIPSWTQPVPTDGNWDEVVLPVVARKRGLDGHYEQADGNVPFKKPESEIVEPAPGTFAFDHTKYRPREVNGIPLYEFGQRPQVTDIPEAEEVQSSTGKNDDPRPAYTRPRSRSPPFSHYTRKGKEAVPEIKVTHSTTVQQGKGEDDAGCCKCVIM